MKWSDCFVEVRRRRRSSKRMTLGQEIWWRGSLGGRPIEIYSKVRLRDTSFYFMTPSNARIHFGMTRRKGLEPFLEDQFVDLVVSPASVTDEMLEKIRVMAQANDTRPVVVRRKQRKTGTSKEDSIGCPQLPGLVDGSSDA